MTDAVESAGFTLNAAQFERFRALVLSAAGIALRDEKRQLVCSRLSRRMRELRLASFDDYYVRVTNDPSGAELQQLVNAITTNKTSFFREAHHFQELTARVLAPCAEGARGRPVRLRLWSAGCSTGEEVYSMMMTVCAELPQWASSDIRLLASDIDTQVLQTAARGVYPEERAEELPPDFAKRYLIAGSADKSGLVRVRKALRERVAFRRINFIEPEWPVNARFDAIFCRNALIYFDHPTQEKIVTRLLDHLVPHGFLFLGHSESLAGARPELRSLGRTAFQRTGEAA